MKKRTRKKAKKTKSKKKIRRQPSRRKSPVKRRRRRAAPAAPKRKKAKRRTVKKARKAAASRYVIVVIRSGKAMQFFDGANLTPSRNGALQFGSFRVAGRIARQLKKRSGARKIGVFPHHRTPAEILAAFDNRRKKR